MGGNFREKLDKALRIKFRGFKFHGTMNGNMNTCAIDVTIRQWVVRERGYHIHEAIWEASQRENSICADPFTVAAAFCSKGERYILVSPFPLVSVFTLMFVNQHSLEGGPCGYGALSTGRSSETEPYLSSSTSSS